MPIRRSRYLAGFVASRHDPNLKAFRARLTAAGKPTEVAIIACARKLLTILDARVKTATDNAQANV
jgi:transposase